MALIDRSIRLTERGIPAIIPEADWHAADLEEPCRLLAERGIVGLRRVGAFRVIEPRQFVGHLRLPGRAITVSPYARELFTSLHRFVTAPPDKKFTAQEAQKSVTDTQPLDPAPAFYSALSDTVHMGLPFVYERMTTTTSRPRGRLLFNDTVRTLRTRGISHRVVCSVSVRRVDDSLGSVISTVASLLNTGYDISSALQLRIGQLVNLFDEGKILNTQEATIRADTLLRIYSDQPSLVRLLMICQAILRAEQVIWDTDIPVPGGECRFCNMDRLWELAVWTAFKEASAAHDDLSVEFHPFGRASIRLLTDGGPRINPDVVVFKNGKPFVIVDAKYSEASSAAADDVYQIVCYTQRLNAVKGTLIYLSPKDGWSEELGRTEGGSVISAGGVSRQHNVALDIVAIARASLRDR